VAGSQAVEQFKQTVMCRPGLEPNSPAAVKFEAADALGISLSPVYNGEMKTREAGKIGGPIGGQMVREMIKMAER
jgi:hypothetical protein